jgi:hypothetical protein
MNDEPTNSDSKDDLIKNVEKIKAEYYETNKKNTFFKSAQKIECAKQVFQNASVARKI